MRRIQVHFRHLLTASVYALYSGSALAQTAETSQRAVDSAITTQDAALGDMFKQAAEASASGKLDQAIDAYQTMLVQNPSLDRVRLDLGLALFKTGRLDAAREQFNLVLEKQIPDIVRRNVEAVLKQIDSASKEHYFSGNAAVGMNYDTNGNSSSSSGKVSVYDTNFTLSPQDTRKADAQGFATVSINHRWQSRDVTEAGVAKPSALAWNSSVMAYKSEQDTLDNLNISLFSLRSGPEYNVTDKFTLGLSGSYTDVLLAGRSYMHSYAGDASANWAITQQHSANLTLTQEYRDFMNSPTSSTFEDRNGQASQAKLGFTYLASPQDIFSLSLTGRSEDTRKNYTNNVSWSPNASYTRVSQGGSFAQFSAGYKESFYAGADSFVSRRTREDQEKTFGLTLGTPLSDHITWMVGYNYRFTNSNIQNYQSDNQRVSTTLAAKF